MILAKFNNNGRMYRSIPNCDESKKDDYLNKGYIEISEDDYRLYCTYNYFRNSEGKPEIIQKQEIDSETLNKLIATSKRKEIKENVADLFIELLRTNDIDKIRADYQSKLVSISDDVALYLTDIFPIWSANSIQYEKGDRILYNNVLYKVLTSHTSQESWKPDISPSLFVKVISSISGEIPEWQQPSADNAYKKGDKVRYKGRIYESLIDNNVWSPEGYPDGWKDITNEIGEAS